MDTIILKYLDDAKAGDQAAIMAIWNECRPYICYRANKRKASATAGGYGYAVDADDLIQESYFALITAIKSYDPEKGRFLPYLEFHIKSAFNNALEVRTKRDRLDPIRTATSLEMLLPEYGDNISLLDIIPDPADPFADIISTDYLQSLREIISKAISSLNASEQIKTMLYYLLDNSFLISLQDLSDAMQRNYPDITYDRTRQLYYKGIRQLRRALMKRSWYELYKDYYFPEYATSFYGWRRNGSSVEAAVIKRDQVLSRLTECNQRPNFDHREAKACSKV